MRLDIVLPRPLGATLVLAFVLLVSGLAIAAGLAGLTAETDERDAKAGFVTRSLAAGRLGAGRSDPVPDSGLALVAESGTLAAARIDALVRATVVAAGGTVLSSRAEAKHDEAAAATGERIEVQVVAQGRIDALQAGLYHLESGIPMVLVDGLSIRPVDAAEPGGPVAQDPILNATFTLSAYWQPPKP